ncbi:hypothetical protein CCHR01_19035 [Colletotrichum chrysophilum]|uniref:Uncharacterized protein n=1 Tax=Colletotrichum chrysophilum TaxID=1836956 RepID=A0AAD9A0G8_9PEZI|nr:hypothetical protein CCHR01_19035 [Colletotrichum chrysophilum]
MAAQSKQVTGVRVMFYRQIGDDHIFDQLWCKNSPAWETKRYGGGQIKSTRTPFDGGPVYSPDAQCRGRRQVSVKWVFGDGKGLDSNHPLRAELDGCFRSDDFKKRCKDGLKSIVKIVAKGVEEKYTTVLGLDFGGFSMSGCPIRARASPCVDAAAFFRLGDPFGAGGGTEHWESYISEFCTEETLKPDGPDRKKSFLDENLRAQLLESFHQQIAESGVETFREMRLHANISDSIPVLIPESVVKATFEAAMKAPLDMAQKHINELGRLYGASHQCRVVVTGGSARHFEVQRRLRQCCKDAGLRFKPIFAYDTANGSPAFNVARGAALATSKSITVNEYLSNGAAFGIQMLQRDLQVPKQVSGGRVASNNDVWDDTAAILFNQKHRSADITTSGTDRLKIICDPFHGRGNKAGLLLAHDRCYDVVELPIPKKGTWRFTVDSVRQGHDGERMFLQLSRRRLGEVSTEVPVLHVELYFDRTANCYLIYDGNGKIDDAHRGLALTDENQLVACSSATTSPQVEEAAPVPEGTSQAKRMMKRTRQMAPMARLPFTPTKRAKPVATSSGTNDTPSYKEARESPVNGMSV